MPTPLHVADRVLTNVSRATHLVAFLNPLNLHEEEQAFSNHLFGCLDSEVAQQR